MKAIGVLSSLFIISTGYLFWNYKSSQSDFRILTYSSFISGAGKLLSKEFEEQCNCSVQFVNAGSGEMISKILKVKKNVDLVVGLNSLSFLDVEKLKWRKIELNVVFAPQIRVRKEVFVPYDWSPMGFVYRKEDFESPPRSWNELLNHPEAKISLQDPRLSTPGIFFQYWIFSQKSMRPEFIYKKLKPLVHSYAPSWSSSYNLFQKRISNLVFTYQSSLIYHWNEQKDERYQFLMFDEHPYQVEYVALPDSCKRCDLAESFVRMMLSQKGQEILSKNNYMFPATLESLKAFGNFSKVSLIDEASLTNFLKKKDAIIKLWKSYL